MRGDDGRAAALARRANLCCQLEELERKSRPIRAEIREIDGFLTTYEQFAQKDSKRKPKRQFSHRDSASARITVAARSLLMQQGGSMSRANLLAGLNRNGLSIPGKNPMNYLSSMLWRERHWSNIMRLPDGGYRITGTEMEPIEPKQTAANVAETPKNP